MKCSPQQLDRAALVIQGVCRTYGITYDELDSHNRTWRIAWPRLLAYHLVRRVTGRSYSWLGSLFNRDGTTIVKGIQSLRDTTDTDPERARELATLESYFPPAPPASGFIPHPSSL